MIMVEWTMMVMEEGVNEGIIIVGGRIEGMMSLEDMIINMMNTDIIDALMRLQS